MDKFSTVTIIKPDTSKYKVNYIRSVIRKGNKKYFDFINDENKKYDEEEFDQSGIYSITSIDCKANFGDMIYIILDDRSGFFEKLDFYGVMYDPVEAIKKAINLMQYDPTREVKVIRVTISPDMVVDVPNKYNVKNYSFNDLKDANDPNYLELFHYNEIVNIKQEYGSNEEIKNLLLSVKGINKFNL